jgi:hypothetical protein
MDRTQQQSVLRGFGAKRGHIFDVENQFNRCLPLSLSFSGRMQKDCRSAFRGAQFDNLSPGRFSTLNPKNVE